MVDYNNTKEMEAVLSSLRRAVKDYLPSYDEYGTGSRKNAVDDIILGSFYDYDNWDSDKDRLPSVKVSDYGLYTLAYEIFNDDFICINPDGTVDVENSNHKDVAEIIANLVPQKILAKVRENIVGEGKVYDMSHLTAIVEGKVRSKLMEGSFDPWHCDMHDWPLVNPGEDSYSNLWKVGIWPGQGYVLSVFRVWANDETDAIEKVVSWLADNDSSLLQDDTVERIREELADEGKSEEEIWEDIEEDFLYVDPMHYIYLDNLVISKFPEEYVKEYGYDNTDSVNESVDSYSNGNSSFYDEEDYDGNTGEPGMVRSYDIGWNDNIDSFEESAKAEKMTLKQFLKFWWNEVSSGVPWTWQKLGSGYGFHGDTILQLGNVTFKDIHGQLMIDESGPETNTRKRSVMPKKTKAPVTEASLNEISADTAGNAIKHAAYSRRVRQMDDMADNTVDKYNKMYEFEDNGFTFKIERTKFEGRPTFFICIRNKEDRNYYKYIIAKDGKPEPIDCEWYDLVNSPIGYAMYNLKAGPRHKFNEMLKAIEALNNPSIGESIHRATEAMVEKLLK